MQGADKLLELIDDKPLLHHAASAAHASAADQVIVVLPDMNHLRAQALQGLKIELCAAPNHTEGMAGSLRDGLAQLPFDCDAVIIALADMPDVTVRHYNALIAAFDPAIGHEICRATSDGGQPGHPVLFSRRFFQSLAGLTGDTGARSLIASAAAFLVDVPTPGQGALVDLDTVQEWQKWRALNRR